MTAFAKSVCTFWYAENESHMETTVSSAASDSNIVKTCQKSISRFSPKLSIFEID